MHRLFSYGTLQQTNVQLATFGRQLEGAPDRLPGFKIDLIEILDPDVVRKSGRTHHPIVRPSNNHKDVIDGVVFLLTDDELAQADAYEVSEYERILAELSSGEEAWVYVSRAAESSGPR